MLWIIYHTAEKQRRDLIKSQKSFLNGYWKEKSWKNFESTKKIFWLHCAKVKSSLDARWTSIVKHCECVSVETLMPTSLLPQFYIQLAYKPYFGIWFLLFGLFGQLRAVRKKVIWVFLIEEGILEVKTDCSFSPAFCVTTFEPIMI